MAVIYCNGETLFGPTEAPNWPANSGQLSQEDQVTVKKEIKIQKERVGYKRKQKKSGSRFPRLLCQVHEMEVVN